MEHHSSNGRTYYLNSVSPTMKDGSLGRPIFYFSRHKGQNYCQELPVGMVVVESKNGFPIARKS